MTATSAKKPAPGGAPLWAVIVTLIGAPTFIGTVIVYVPYTFTAWRFAPPLLGWEATRWIGAALVLLSVPVILDFVVRFLREGHGTPVPIAPPRRLVVRGPYRYVRNPAYVAAVVALVGQGLLFGSRSVLIYALSAWAVFHVFVLAHEEPMLRSTFGAEYEAYCRRVPRWLPRMRHGRAGAEPEA